MTKSELTMPEIGLIGGTRGMLGCGLGLLLADRLSPDKRRLVGVVLVVIGLLSTVPLVAQVLSKRQ